MPKNRLMAYGHLFLMIQLRMVSRVSCQTVAKVKGRKRTAQGAAQPPLSSSLCSSVTYSHWADKPNGEGESGLANTIESGNRQLADCPDESHAEAQDGTNGGADNTGTGTGF